MTLCPLYPCCCISLHRVYQWFSIPPHIHLCLWNVSCCSFTALSLKTTTPTRPFASYDSPVFCHVTPTLLSRLLRFSFSQCHRLQTENTWLVSSGRHTRCTQDGSQLSCHTLGGSPARWAPYTSHMSESARLPGRPLLSPIECQCPRRCRVGPARPQGQHGSGARLHGARGELKPQWGMDHTCGTLLSLDVTAAAVQLSQWTVSVASLLFVCVCHSAVKTQSVSSRLQEESPSLVSRQSMVSDHSWGHQCAQCSHPAECTEQLCTLVDHYINFPPASQKISIIQMHFVSF